MYINVHHDVNVCSLKLYFDINCISPSILSLSVEND